MLARVQRIWSSRRRAIAVALGGALLAMTLPFAIWNADSAPRTHEQIRQAKIARQEARTHSAAYRAKLERREARADRMQRAKDVEPTAAQLVKMRRLERAAKSNPKYDSMQRRSS